MSAWGTKVGDLLRERGKSQKWLAEETGIARSTITNWLANPSVRPDPANVAKVAKAFGLKARDLAPYAGYTITESRTDAERQARIAAIEASPRLAHGIDLLRGLKPRDQDTVLSMIEGLATRGGGDGSEPQ